jgi:uncharacterized protein (TIGR03067 family)
MGKRLIVLGMAVGLISVARGGDAAKKDLERLQGSWKTVELVESGKKVGADTLKALQVLIKGELLTVKEKGEVVEQFTIKLDPAKKPKAIDLFFTKGKDKGKKMLGIYAVEANTAKLCFDEEGKKRPTEFASPEKSNITLVVLGKK